MSAKPSQTIFPVLVYADARRAMAWMEDICGFTVQQVSSDAAGRVSHAELDDGRSVLMMSGVGLPQGDNPWPTAEYGVYVTVSDPDAVYRRAAAAGYAVPDRVEQKPHAREFTMRDPEGKLWCFGTYSPELIAGHDT